MTYPQLPAAGRQRQEAFNECHVYRHWWQPTTVVTEGAYYIQFMVCARCTTERRWKVHRLTGDPVANSYTAPDGYYQKSENRQQTRKDLRIKEIERNRSIRKIRRVV